MTAFSAPNTQLAECGGSLQWTVASDGQRLCYRRWGARQTADAAVYLHGIAGHSYWFGGAATRLAESGITVYGHDRRGSGLNRHFRPGHLSHHRVLLRDIHHMVRLARQAHPGGRVFLIAGCWGAKAGAVCAARASHMIDGLVLIAPALRTQVGLPRADLVGVVKSLLTDPRRPFPIPLSPEQYTENSNFREFIANDAARLRTATARFYLETVRIDRLAQQAPPQIVCPTALFLGGRDAIVNVEGTRSWFDHVAAPDKTMHIYPSFAHILEFEEDQAEYLRDLTGWLQAHGSSSEAGVSAARMH
ncbi:MAG: alpha/beta fold hydrolase [Chloroflexota bacterium]